MPHTFITGANRGIGLGFARRLLADGHIVTAACRRPDDAAQLHALADQHPGRLHLAALDLADPASITRCAGTLRARGTGPDWVLSNAGVSHAQALGSYTPDALHAMLTVNAAGPALLAQAITPLMPDGGTLVHLSSGLASLTQAPSAGADYDGYAMSKAAVNMLTRRLARALTDRRIVCVALSPGWVQTNMGGSDADLTVPQAVDHMLQTLRGLTPAQSGAFLDHLGTPLPW